MKMIVIASLCSVAISGASVRAQTTERVDPMTGNYVPVRDPLERDGPDPNRPNPNRLGNRLSPGNSPKAAPRSLARTGNKSDGLTAAQRMAGRAANNGQASPLAMTSNSQSDQTTAAGFVSMGGMSVYVPPSAQSDADVVAKPEWWPQ